MRRLPLNKAGRRWDRDSGAWLRRRDVITQTPAGGSAAVRRLETGEVTTDEREGRGPDRFGLGR